MALQLFYHPLSSYCQKVLIALYENATPFEPRLLEGPGSPAMVELAQRWPIQRFPMRVDCGAAPFPFCADWTHPIGEAFPHVKAYRQRLRGLSFRERVKAMIGLAAPQHREALEREAHGLGPA